MPARSDIHAGAFGPGAERYARLRPDYPPDAVAWLVPADAARVADVGAGTGQLAAALVDAGHDVVAVEPLARMRGVLAATLPGVEVRAGTGEATGLVTSSVDAVVYGQAWHWVDRERAAAEASRVLRPGGWLAMAWNDPDTSVAWVARYQVAQRGLKRRPSATRRLARSMGADFQPRECAEFAWERETTKGDLVELVTTFSYWLSASERARAGKLAAVREQLDADLPGPDDTVVCLPYVTRAYRYRLVARAGRRKLAEAEAGLSAEPGASAVLEELQRVRVLF